MADLLSSAQKADVHSAFDDIHDTFSREIYIFKKGQQTLIGIDDDYNYFYDRRKNSKDTEPQYERYVTQARVKYFAEHEESNELDDQGLKLTFPYGGIRLKLNEAAYNLVISAKKIEVDGKLYTVRSDVSRTGPFWADYRIVYLKRED